MVLFGSYLWFVLFMGFCIVFLVLELAIWWKSEKKVYFSIGFSHEK
nr:ATP synthase F0 subunit 8 [Brachidontes pharaonis]